jgi:hypothetical protein
MYSHCRYYRYWVVKDTIHCFHYHLQTRDNQERQDDEFEYLVMVEKVGVLFHLNCLHMLFDWGVDQNVEFALLLALKSQLMYTENMHQVFFLVLFILFRLFASFSWQSSVK